MLKHELRQENPDLAAMVQKTRRRQLEHEGVATVRYTLQALTPLPLYTKVEVTLPPPPAKVSSAARKLNLYKIKYWCLYFQNETEKGLFEILTSTIQETQNKVLNKMAEKLNEVSNDLFKGDDKNNIYL